MSRPLVDRSADLKRLEREGYDLSIQGTNLLVKVPYVNAQRKIAQGILVSELTTEGGATTETLALRKVVIIGLGGTGSYILDLVAKTPVQAIHLYDGDVMLTHNAFRSPGAPTIEELEKRLRKVDYLEAKYDAMHRQVI